MYGILGLGGKVGLEKKIISEIDRARLAQREIGNGGFGIKTCELDRGLPRFWVFSSFFYGIWEPRKGERKKIISEIDRARLVGLVSVMVDLQSTDVRIRSGFT